MTGLEERIAKGVRIQIPFEKKGSQKPVRISFMDLINQSPSWSLQVCSQFAQEPQFCTNPKQPCREMLIFWGDGIFERVSLEVNDFPHGRSRTGDGIRPWLWLSMAVLSPLALRKSCGNASCRKGLATPEN